MRDSILKMDPASQCEERARPTTDILDSESETSSCPVKKNTKPCQDVVPYNKTMAEAQEKMYGNTCFRCKKKDYYMKHCIVCKRATYCDRKCQKKDYKRHKHICERISKFDAANARIEPNLRHHLFRQLGYKGISYMLGSIPDAENRKTRVPRSCVLVEIMAANFLLPDLKIKVKDAANRTADVIFSAIPQGGLQVGKALGCMAFLARGNFLLIINGQWMSATSGSSIVVLGGFDDMVVVEMGYAASWQFLNPALMW